MVKTAKALIEALGAQPLTTSLIVAAHFNKSHTHVIGHIERLADGLAALNFDPMFVKASYDTEDGRRSYPMYYMNRDGFTVLAMSLTGKKALRFKLALTQTLGTAFGEVPVATNAAERIMPLEKTLAAWFGQECGLQMFEMLSAPVEPPEEVVFVLLMSNGTTKIGVADDFEKRLRAIELGSGMEVVKWCHSGSLIHKGARQIETACHKAFKEHRRRGETFDVPFETARAEVEKYAQIVGQNS